MRKRDTRPVTMAELQGMRLKAAMLVLKDPIYVPILERVEREIQAVEARESVIERARRIVER